MYNVDGFLFEDEATAELAKKEEEGIRFIKERTALNNPEVVFKLYKKLLDQNLFVTPVGQRFLVELQNVLLSSNYIARADIPPIMVAKEEVPHVEEERPVQIVTQKIDKKVGGEYRTPFYVALFFALVFGVSVIGMFLINELSSNSVTILNYREAIENEYAGWAVELQEKEAELREREKALKEREAELEARENDMVIDEMSESALNGPFLPLEENSDTTYEVEP